MTYLELRRKGLYAGTPVATVPLSFAEGAALLRDLAATSPRRPAPTRRGSSWS